MVMTNKALRIGPVTIQPPTILAPLAGITDLPFRLMAKDAGCGLVCSEMISANGLVYGSKKTFKMLESTDRERPLSIQIFGADPGIMAEAARMVEGAGADILDINFGCSVKKVVKTDSGVALMRDPQRAEKIMIAVRKAIAIPLTIKIRSGWDPSGKQAFEIASMAEQCGVDALCLHPRTAGQGFGGKAYWPLIAALKQKLSIPLIGNGDITSPELAHDMFEQTGCEGIMIGRAALSDPDIFRRTSLFLENKIAEPLSLDDHFRMMGNYLKNSIDHHGESIACNMMRSRLGFLVKGLPGCSTFRKKLVLTTCEKDIRDCLSAFQLYLDSDHGKEQLARSDS